MGVEQSVTFAGDVPDWPAVRARLGERNYPVQMRMIEGQLAFPDEAPPAEWREIRLGTPSGMVTLRREPGRVTFVVWGNADAGMQRARNALMWAFAETGSGQVEGTLASEEFRRTADLPEEIRAR
jgi:hypothetical protein